MKETLRQSMAWLHGWTGLLVGWVLFFVFLTGTLSYVQDEITYWMEPEKTFASDRPSIEEILPKAVAYLSEHAPDAVIWGVLMPQARTGTDLQLIWQDTPEEGAHISGEGFHSERLDPVTGLPSTVKIRDTGGGEHLYRMHYSLHYLPGALAIKIVGICAMFMLVAILSGIVTHKKIFKDFFTFRPAKGQRSWLDGHNLLSVAALPFHLMITYTGLVIYMLTYMPVAPSVIYAGEPERFRAEAFQRGSSPEILPDAPQANMVPITPMIDKAERLSQGKVRQILIRNPGRANSDVTVGMLDGRSIGQRRDLLISFDGVTGKRQETNSLIRAAGQAPSPPANINNILRDLHIADFAGPYLRLLFVLSGLAGAAMIGTGLVLWTKKRKAKLRDTDKPHFGIALVDRLNVGSIVGLPIAIAGYFWANRLLPVVDEIAGIHRHDMEVHCMFFLWAAMFIYPTWRPLNHAWVEMLALAAFAYGFIPALNALTTDRSLIASIPQGDWVMASFDLISLATGALFAWAAWKLHRRVRTAIPQDNIQQITPQPEAA